MVGLITISLVEVVVMETVGDWAANEYMAASLHLASFLVTADG